MADILNFKEPFNPTLFDQLVSSALDKSSPASKESDIALHKFKNNEEAYLRIEPILTGCKLTESHFIALQIFENLIKTRFYTFNDEQKVNFRVFLFKLMVEKSRINDIALPKYNQVFINLIKREWPSKYPNLVSELINTAQSINIACCTNTFRVFKLLIEEIYCAQNVEVKFRKYKGQITRDVPLILDFVNMVMEKGKGMDESLVENAFVMLSTFVKYVLDDFDDNFVRYVTSYLNSRHTISVVKVLYEINRKKENELVNDEFFRFLSMYFNKFKSDHGAHNTDMFSSIPVDGSKCINKLISGNFRREYGRMTPSERDFLLQSSYLMTTIKNDTFTPFVIAFAELSDLRIFKVLLDKLPLTNKTFSVILSKMPRPIEVLIVENEDGEIVREKVEGTENLEFGKMMAYKAWQFAHSNSGYAKSHLLQILESLFSMEDEMNSNLLNRMCWTVGCIQGALSSEEEDPFYVDVLKDLLTLCENRHRKEDKAIIASNIMYVVGKYYQFLKRNRNFLRTVVKKLFEFMKEEYEGIKDMACDTLLMICEKVTIQDLNQEFVGEIIENLNEITLLLQNYQKRIVYTSVLIVIQNRTDLIEKLCAVLKNTNFGTKETCHYIKSQTLVLRYYVSYEEAKFILNFFNNSDLYVKYDVLEYFVAYFRHVKFEEATFDMAGFFINLGPFDFRNLNVLSALSARINGYEENEDPSDENDENRVERKTRQVSAIPVDTPITNSYFDSIINLLIIPSIPGIKRSDDFAYAYYNFIEKSVNIVFINKILLNDEFMETVYAGLTYQYNISLKCVKILSRLYQVSAERDLVIFMERNVLRSVENLIGIILDKDKEYIFNECVVLLQYLLKNNYMNAQTSLLELLSALQNISKEYVLLFIKGMVEINSRKVLFEHVKDFKIRALEYFDNDEYNDELELLGERIYQ
ncbi:hypothetical protein VCUG_00823 [Vavraia culicis subsp. floridensis]|uniref:Exportin-1/Importin-beta-like domain-containing protein n=1 Tax=Vavraia culicis (isolate floridensis) TaxID=948595 RepID=L2GVN7_VAVCU|nr:uncharacterized protein VCUG_00823 [Vavraia culicis subsp. floridensis]ELA47741.1 hypothetical protein VCUG_00823 [Vavraia culicis subsp. floridensis]